MPLFFFFSLTYNEKDFDNFFFFFAIFGLKQPDFREKKCNPRKINDTEDEFLWLRLFEVRYFTLPSPHFPSPRDFSGSSVFHQPFIHIGYRTFPFKPVTCCKIFCRVHVCICRVILHKTGLIWWGCLYLKPFLFRSFRMKWAVCWCSKMHCSRPFLTFTNGSLVSHR